MNKKILAIITALLLAASLCACGNNEEEESTSDTKIDIPGGSETQGTGEDESDESEETDDQTGNVVEDDDHNSQTYVDLSEAKTVYILHPNGAVKLHGTGDVKDTSLANGTAVSKIAESQNGEWSKVVYNETTYYVVTKCTTPLADLDEGFVEVSKTLTKSEGYLNIRNTPTMDNHIIGDLETGEEVKVVAENTTTGWYKIEFVDANGNKAFGYVASDAKYFEGEETSATETETTTETAAQ